MTAVVLDGIVLGLAFGLLGVGMTLVYGLGGVLNLAYGQMVVLAAIVVMLVMEDDVATFLAALAGVLAVAGVAVLLDLTLMRAVYREHGEERTLLGLLLTLGVAFVIAGLLTWRYPSGALYIFIGGDPVFHDEHDDHCREHHDLPVRQVEDAAEPVDERHPDAEEAERQPEHDPVEDHRFHATPRYARRTSGFWSSSAAVPLSRMRPFSST